MIRRLRRRWPLRVGFVLAGSAVALLVALVVMLIHPREPNRYFPFLQVAVADAETAVPKLGIRCPQSSKPEVEPFKNWPPLLSVASCASTTAGADSRVRLTFYGDDRGHITSLLVTARAPTEMLAPLVTKLVRAKGSEGRRLDEWLRQISGVGERYMTDRLKLTLTEDGESVRQFFVEAADRTAPIAPAGRSVGDSLSAIDVERLARALAPTFVYHPHDYRPLDLNELAGRARICESESKVGAALTDCSALESLPVVTPCGGKRQRDCPLQWVLDLPPSVHDPQAFRGIEQSIRAGGSVPTVYWRAARLGRYRMVIQYWAYYLFNDWQNDHEGDWETVQIDLLGTESTNSVFLLRWFYSAHDGGNVHACDAVRCAGPTVMVAKGSHANYAKPGTHPVTVTCKGPGCLRTIGEDDARAVESLPPTDYRLVELTGEPFLGTYGSRNVVPLWRDRTAPKDPRSRPEWSDPLADFATAPYGRPSLAAFFYLEPE